MDKELRTILTGIKENKITERAADALLQAEYGITLETLKRNDSQSQMKKHVSLPVVVAAMFLLLSGIALYSIQGDITGMATFEIQQNNITAYNETIEVPISSLLASGTLTGEADAIINFITENRTYRVATLTWNDGTPLTTLPSYDVNQTVTLLNQPTDATYYIDNGTHTVPTTMPFKAPSQSVELLIIANQSGELSTHRIPVLIGDYTRQTKFSSICEETCELNGTTGTAVIIVEEGAHIDVTLRGESITANSPPVLLVPYDNITINSTVEINLSGHFFDEDELFYSVGGSDLLETEVTEDRLTLTPIQSGTEELSIYTSDLEELVQTTLIITVDLPEVTIPEANNTTTPEVNETTETNVTTNMTQTNLTVNTPVNVTNLTLNCDNTNPNMRPVECLQELGAEAFPDRVINWETVDREVVGQFNRIGNLLIKGEVVEYSSGRPAPNDFSINGADRDLNSIPLVWIDSSTGDLHINGRLYEAEVNLQPPVGSYSVKSSRSIYFAYVDMSTGDLHLLGNVIPYRRSLE